MIPLFMGTTRPKTFQVTSHFFLEMLTLHVLNANLYLLLRRMTKEMVEEAFWLFLGS